MITLKEVKKNTYALEFIKETERKLKRQLYTNHGLDHSKLVSARARTIANVLNLSKNEQELSAIAAYYHDFANFLSRSQHNYLGSLLFYQVFSKEFTPNEIIKIMEAISNHDKLEMEFTNKVSAIVVIADKSDVRRERVTVKDIKIIKSDIHNRVNFAVKRAKIDIDKKNNRIILNLKIDTKFVPVIEYFEIFTERMTYCRKAAKYLGYNFGLVINNFKLL